MTGNKNNQPKNTLTTHSTKPFTPPVPGKPQMPQFNKPIFRGPSFNSSNAFRNQNRGSGGK